MNEGLSLLANSIGIKVGTIWWFIVVSWIVFIYNRFTFGSENLDAFFEKWFSRSYISTFKWVFFLFAFLTWYGGIGDDLAISFNRENFAYFFGQVIGSVVGLIFLSLLGTYVARLIIPLVKKIHDKAQ